jgi:phytoene/squalene synthetase
MAAPVTIEEVSKEDRQAAEFITAWNGYCHSVDDLVDEPSSAETKLKTHQEALKVYSSPFFVRHAERLWPVIDMVVHMYADSVLLQEPNDAVERALWDHLRQAPLNVVVAVADICGGWNHARSVSLRIRKDGWARTHHPDGTPH